MSEGVVRTHKDLAVWKEAMQLVKAVYEWTTGFPKEEMYGLTAQMRRAALSIPCNIAEGAARGSRKEFLQFLHISLGSLAELETQVFLAEDLFQLEAEPLKTQIEGLRRKLLALMKTLKAAGAAQGREHR
ncbi:MAG: four helix bundle protein [Candidatus Bipolaricaulota bacterium]|nr:four helix bundle protein [Candidatus Bipolaricaulota bacterium]